MLKFSISADEHATLPEQLQEHYKQGSNGFTLDVDAESSEAITGLKSALTKERADRKAFETKVAALTESLSMVNAELETLRKADALSSLRSAVIGAVPPHVRPESIEDIMIHAERDLQITEAGDDSTSYATADGKSVGDWLGALLEKRPHWLQPSVGSGATGGTGVRHHGMSSGSTLDQMKQLFK